MDAQTNTRPYAATSLDVQRSWLGRFLLAILPILILLGGIAALMIMMATANKPPKNDGPPSALAVEMAPAVIEQTNARIEGTGEVKPRTETELSARASGQITWVSPRFEAGAEVRSGERLLQIDPSNYKLALETMEADAARARETLTRVRAESALAAQDYRDLGLKEQPSDLALGRPQIATAEANLRAAEARIEEARLTLNRTTVLAPYTGRVLKRSADVGDFVTMGMPVASLFSTDKAQVRVPLTDLDLRALGLFPGFAPSKAVPAPDAKVTADIAGTVAEWTGKLVAVDASIDANSRQTFALIEIDNPFASPVPLAPGTFAKVSLAGSKPRELIKVPRGALKRGTEVYVVRADSKIEVRPVVLVQSDSQFAWLAGNVADGEKVVVSYVPSARNGLEVSDIRNPKPVKAEEPEDTKDKKKKKKSDKKKEAAKNDGAAKTE